MENNLKIIILILLVILAGTLFVSREKVNFAFGNLLASLNITQGPEIVGDGGFGNSVAMSLSGNLAVSFIDTEGKLIFAKKIGEEWQKEVVDSNALAGNTTSLAFNGKGESSILYIDKNFSLKLAKKLGENWEIEKIFDEVALSFNLVFDSKDNPNISFWSTAKGALVFAKRIAGEWQIEFLDSGGVGWWNSLALDQEQNPHISYYDFENKDLLYLFFDGKTWQKEIVDFENDVGRFNSIALDSDSQVHISYFDETNSNLKYAQKTEGGWKIETVSQEGGERTKILLDEKENPIIFFIENSDLKIAKKTDNFWKIKKIASGEFSDNSFLLDSKGNHHLLWQDLSQGKLKYLKVPL
jgi:hypothetical protein